MSAPIAQRRLASLDVLRGFDLFLLVFLQPVLWSLLHTMDTPVAQAVLYHFDHEVWNGFRFWDLVMPLFLFMSGASMPFALSRFVRRELPLAQAYRKILRRFCILFVLGMVVQGNILALDAGALKVYVNTLQAIAVGYVIAAAILLHFRLRGRLVATLLLLLGYAVPMLVCGDFSLEGNLSSRIDAMLMGHFQGDPSYAWILPSLNFGVTVMLGVFTGEMIRMAPSPNRRTVWRLLALGAALVVAGLLLDPVIPINKRIWSTSMTLLSGGYCIMLMAAFYAVVDVCSIHRAFLWLKIYGMNSIVAYMLGETVNFRCIVASLCYGFEQYLGEYYETLLTFGNFLLLFFILYGMYRARIFVKI